MRKMYNSTKMYIPIVELERISLRLHNFERINRAATGVPFRTERGREFFLDSVSPGEKKKRKKKYEKPFARCRLISTGESSSSSTSANEPRFSPFRIHRERRSSATIFGSFVSTSRVAWSSDKGCTRGIGIDIERERAREIQKLKTFLEKFVFPFVYRSLQTRDRSQRGN